MWILLDKYEHYERWVNTKEIVTIVRRHNEIELWGTKVRLADIQCNTAEEAKERMAKLLECIALSPDADTQPVNVLTYEQELKLKIADAAIEMQEACGIYRPVDALFVKHAAMSKLIESLNAYLDNTKAGE